MQLEDLHLSIGDSLQLQLFRQQEVRYPVKLIGFALGGSMLTTSPKTANGKSLLLREGERANVRLIASNRVIAFMTQIVAVRMQPYAYLHLSLPADIEAVEVRKSLRVNVQIRASIINQNGTGQGAVAQELAFPASVVNMSATGLRLESNRPLGRKGDPLSITLEIRVADFSRLVTLNGEICAMGRIEREDNSGGVFHGVELRELDAEESLFMRTFVYEQLLTQMRVL